MAKKTVTAWMGIYKSKPIYLGQTRRAVYAWFNECVENHYESMKRIGLVRIVKAKITWEDK